MKTPPEAQCRFCKCTNADPCRLEAGEECGWQNKARTCCTNPKCLKALQAEGRNRFAAAERDGREQKKERLSKVQAALRRNRLRKKARTA